MSHFQWVGRTQVLRGLAGKRILIVEDEHLVAEYERTTLEGCGAIIAGRVANESAAFAALLHGGADVVALDWNLRGDRPLKLASYLASRSIPFVIVSGYARETLPPEVRSAPYVQKPFAQDELVRTLFIAISASPAPA
jgi:CheY-like chemotaxis protein